MPFPPKNPVRMTPVEYSVEFFPNKKIAEFHFVRQVPHFHRIWREKNTMEGELLQEKLEAITGVTQADGRDYSVTIHRGGAFRWDDIEPGVLEVMRDYFNPESVSEFKKIEVYP